MRRILLVLAMALPASPARAQTRVVAKEPKAATKPAEQKVSSRSPGGRHLFEVTGGVVRVNGREVQQGAAAKIVGEPSWRSDGDALAWIERGGGTTRLVVLPVLAPRTPPLAWDLPNALASDRVHWAGPSQVVIGPAVMVPHAIASWAEDPDAR